MATTVLIIIISGIIFFLYSLVNRKKKRDLRLLDAQCDDFKSAIKAKDLEDIVRTSEILIWNSAISYEVVLFMYTSLSEFKSDSKVNEIWLTTYNKKLDFEKHVSYTEF